MYGCIFCGFVTVLGCFLESSAFYLSQRMVELVVQLLCSVRTWFSVCRISHHGNEYFLQEAGLTGREVVSVYSTEERLRFAL